MSSDMLTKRMFLILHDPFTGKPEVGHDLLRCGLVCAELAELMIAGRLMIENDRVVPLGGRGTGIDEISAFVMESIQRQTTTHTVRSWVGSFADVIYELVARALIADGVVRREKRTTVLRRKADRFHAVDLIRAAGPRLQLERMLRTPHERDVPGAVLAAIVGALGVERILDVDVKRSVVRKSVEAANASLPLALHNLIAGVGDSVAEISLIVRR